MGSLLFTVGALFAAPQVVAFLGLTHFAGGLDRAATPQQPPTPTTVPGAPAAPIPATQALLPAGTLPVAFAAPPRLQLPKHPAPPVLTLRPRGVAFAPATASYWAARPVDPAANFHWVTRGMLLAIGALVLLAIAGIANLANRFGG